MKMMLDLWFWGPGVQSYTNSYVHISPSKDVPILSRPTSESSMSVIHCYSIKWPHGMSIDSWPYCYIMVDRVSKGSIKSYFCWMKLSLMPTWTCRGPTGSYWCHRVPLAVHRNGWSQYPHIQCLWAYTEMPCALRHLVSSWQGPCTHKFWSWSHHLVDDADDVEYPGDCVEAPVDDGEALDGLKKH